MITPIHKFCADCRILSRMSGVAMLLALAFYGATSAVAAPPDLTAGGTIPTATASAGTFNLGATGMRGWAYYVNQETTDSRQIQLTAVDAGSPAAGVLAVNDVILGASGTGASPVAFSSDARKSMATAIADAEARDPGILNLLRWRAGTTTSVQITLRTMGAYSATAPYDCPKSAKILREGAAYFLSSQTSGRYSFGTLALLAAKDPADPNNAAYLTRAQTEARAMVPSVATMTQMMSNVRETASTWERGHALIVLAEYYLATSDAVVLPAIEAYAVNIARNLSLFGTCGHIFAEKNADGSDNGPMGGVYGVVNSTGLPCFYGLLLARECGITHATLAPAIERSSRFFAYYSGLGAIPYGEHEPYATNHESNGKSGLAALAFALQTNRVNEGTFFAKMATASTDERDIGHTGAFFNYLWAPLGAASGGEAAAAAFFGKVSWHFDLARRWNGAFVYDHLGSNGTSPSKGAEYNDFRMTSAALLTYALPLRNLRITGKNQNPLTPWLSSADVSAAIAANDYNPVSRSNDQLVTDLGSWSPKVRIEASDQLKTRTVNAALISQVAALANDTNGTSRVGACLALGKITDSGSANARAATLAALLTDTNNHVRFMAADALRNLGTSRTPVVNTILAAAATTAQPLKPFVEEDPLQFAHAKTAMLLFYSGSAYGPKGVLYNTITGIDRNLLYPAIRAVAATPTGLARSTVGSTYKLLTLNDTLAVADSIVDSVQFRAPADKMFSSGVRQSGIEVLQKYGFAEGIPLSMIYMDNDGRGSVQPAAVGVLQAYAGACTKVVPDPGVIEYLQALGTTEAQTALAAITAIPNSNPGPATPLKSIQSVAADAATLTLPAQATTLRVNATDYARGASVNSIYTWRKVHGAGAVTFTPNGTTASANAAIQIAAIPGNYLFEVTMSDSRGLTEVSSTVPVTLYNSGGTLPPNSPPVANPQQVTVAKATPTPITLTGSDPEGYALVFTVTSEPLHGSLSGSAPNLVYTPDSTYSGADGFSFEVMDSEGQKATATVGITVSSIAPPLAIYEPFNYTAGGLNGKGGTTEFGLTGTWVASSDSLLIASSPGYGPLPVSGGSIGGLGGSINRFGGSRAVSPSALAGNGLLADGATLWFSVIMGYETGGNNTRLGFALANSQFNAGNFQYYINNEGPQLGLGVGVSLSGNGNGAINATQFRDSTFGTGTTGNVFGNTSGTILTNGNSRLIVVKITWGATSDTIEVYAPDASLNLGPVISTLTVEVNQSTFDTITWARGDKVVLDEIRFGASYSSVLFGTTPDLTPPTLAGSAIVDDKSGSPVTVNTLVTYTVTFSEDMDAATVTSADFGNAGTAAVTVGAVTETTPGVFTVPVTPTSAGTLQLRVNATAVLKDVVGNALINTSAIPDDTTLTVNSSYTAWAGGAAFTADANNDGVTNGLAWLLGAANASVNAGGLLPVPTREASKLVLVFRCLKSVGRGTAVLKVQYSNDLGLSDPWTSHEAVVPDVDGTVGAVFFDTTADADPEFINVRAEIPASGKVFARLHSTGG